jgi:hypothetical protein
MACTVARNLLKLYARAVSASSHARAPLLAGMLPDAPGFPAARAGTVAAGLALSSARREYWRHRYEHCCPNAVRPNLDQEMRDSYRKTMLDARALFDSASEKHDYLLRLSAEFATPDGDIAIDQALRACVQSHEVYLETMRLYADQAVFGELPKDSQTEGSNGAKPN